MQGKQKALNDSVSPKRNTELDIHTMFKIAHWNFYWELLWLVVAAVIAGYYYEAEIAEALRSWLRVVPSR